LVEITLAEAGRELKTHVGEIPQVFVDAYYLDADDFVSLRTTLRELAESVAVTAESEASESISFVVVGLVPGNTILWWLGSPFRLGFGR
jgi:hypothetical protein